MTSQPGASAVSAIVPFEAPVFTPGSACQIGIAALLQAAYMGIDLKPLGTQLIAHLGANPDDANAMMDLSIILQLLGSDDSAVATQAEAIRMRQVYRLPTVRAGEVKLRLLAIMIAGDFMANTPLEFMLGNSDVALEVLYVSPDRPLPAALPAHDVLFIAVGESDQSRALLRSLAGFAKGWNGPLVNQPDKCMQLSRDRVAILLQSEPGLCMPVTVRAERSVMAQIANGARAALDLLGDGDFPLIVRPVGSHAGKGLEKIETAAALPAYLEQHGDDAFYISRFVDYRNTDGQFRKYRIALIEGRPYLCHMAISDNWMIHYLNAGMSESAAKRAEEAAVMESFDRDFAVRHRAAFALIQQRFGLDYLAMDCSESADGELLIFEVDTSMIVHAIDPVDVFPYKQTQMRKVFDAFRAMLMRAAERKHAA
ncbi:MAG TPA: RimK family alpha-L-glutamate ligase [Herbaspirillum sp.]|jgi:glutathione synthase/RimK-type ligase-like ATP-grasp enzyme